MCSSEPSRPVRGGLIKRALARLMFSTPKGRSPAPMEPGGTDDGVNLPPETLIPDKARRRWRACNGGGGPSLVAMAAPAERPPVGLNSSHAAVDCDRQAEMSIAEIDTPGAYRRGQHQKQPDQLATPLLASS